MRNNKTNLVSRSEEKIIDNRKKLNKLFQNSPLPVEELMVNLHLYIRSPVLAKILYLDELYRLILDIPGIIMEFGCWWGANLISYESLRAVYEPYNYTRKVVGFDTFKGYQSISQEDGESSYAREGAYCVSKNYVQHLSELFDYHTSENTMPNIKKYELIKGDATKTIVSYFEKYPETIVALAYFDMQLYKPTKKCLETIKPHLIKGSVIAMDELNCRDFPGETIAFKEVFDLDNCILKKSNYLPDRTYMFYNV